MKAKQTKYSNTQTYIYIAPKSTSEFMAHYLLTHLLRPRSPYRAQTWGQILKRKLTKTDPTRIG